MGTGRSVEVKQTQRDVKQIPREYLHLFVGKRVRQRVGPRREDT